MSHERDVWQVLLKATSEGSVPKGIYGPATCRWATAEEMKRFNLLDCPLVHLDRSGEIDCYSTTTSAVVVKRRRQHCGETP
jgi:hypothetical protein